MLKKIALTLAGIILLLIIIGFLYIQTLKPSYSGTKSLIGLTSQVDVLFDDYGIPHIYGQTKEDAYRGLGYVHAQDRLWQMEMIRRIAPGRLSELFGEPSVATDKLFRTLGIHQYSKKEAQRFEEDGNEEIKSLVNAYLSGINQFVEHGPTPVEFIILGLEKTPFTLVDVYNTIGYMAFSFAVAQRTEPIIDRIHKQYGPDYLKDLDIHVPPNSTLIPNYTEEDAETALSNQISQLIDHLPVPAWIGSNSWVLGPDKTKSGQVILANDPHIGFSQPAIWYEAHIEAPDFRLYGYHLAGFPFANVGHTDEVAFGLTMLENDDMDLFRESINPENGEQYLFKGEHLDFSKRIEKIAVKANPTIDFEVRETHHGPVLNPAIENMEEKAPISMYWTFLKFPNQLLESTFELIHSQKPDDAREGASKIHGPGLNVMYGDKNGNIAWWAAAKLMKRPDHVNSKLILDGSSGDDEPLGYYSFEENPRSINPPWGYVYSANNQPEGSFGLLLPGYYLPEDRARRIQHLLDQDKKWDVDEVKYMLLDVTSENVPEILHTLLDFIEPNPSDPIETQALQILKDWDGNFRKAETAPVIYTKLLSKTLEATMADELGESSYETFLYTHMLKRSVQKIFLSDESIWWNNVDTEDEIETKKQVVTLAFRSGIMELTEQLGTDPTKWKWGKVHTLEHGHPLGSVKMLKPLFNVGPFEVDGNAEVINNLMFAPSGDGVYEVYAGPSTRRIVDFSDVENNSWSILPTGQSGNPLSQFYKDQAKMFAEGEFRKQLMDKEFIQSNHKYKLTLQPTKTP